MQINRWFDSTAFKNYSEKTFKRRITDLDDSFHHAHHLVDDGDDLVRPLWRRHVGPVGGRQDVAAGHVQDVRGREFEVNRGAVGVVDDGREEGVFSWMDTENTFDKIFAAAAVCQRT